MAQMGPWHSGVISDKRMKENNCYNRRSDRSSASRSGPGDRDPRGRRTTGRELYNSHSRYWQSAEIVSQDKPSMAIGEKQTKDKGNSQVITKCEGTEKPLQFCQ